MLSGLKALFDSVLGAPEAPAVDPAHRLRLATAVLLVEVMHADRSIGAIERETVVGVLRRRFALDADEGERLLELARAAAREATDFHAFTTALNEQLDMASKLEVVEAMWQVAYADGTLEAHEQHVLWRVADLLHVPHGAYINAKMRAKAAADGRG